MTALRLIIQNHPSWQPVLPADNDSAQSHKTLPVESYKIYMVLGRRNAQWHTIVPRIDALNLAIDAMDSANRSALFDRLVVAEAQTLSGQPATRWETAVCAVPGLVRQQDTPSFEAVLAHAQRKIARQNNQPMLELAEPILAKQDATLFMVLLVLIGLWSQSWQALAGVTALCLFETAYQIGWLDRLIVPTQARAIRTARLYLYALCAGLIALPLATALFLQIH